MIASAVSEIDRLTRDRDEWKALAMRLGTENVKLGAENAELWSEVDDLRAGRRQSA